MVVRNPAGGSEPTSPHIALATTTTTASSLQTARTNGLEAATRRRCLQIGVLAVASLSLAVYAVASSQWLSVDSIRIRRPNFPARPTTAPSIELRPEGDDETTPPPTSLNIYLAHEDYAAPLPRKLAMMTPEEVVAFQKSKCPSNWTESDSISPCFPLATLVRAWYRRKRITQTAAGESGREWVIVVAGAHPGYRLAAILEGLGVPGYTRAGLAAQLHRHIRRASPASIYPWQKPCTDELCGECCDCVAKPLPLLGQHRSTSNTDPITLNRLVGKPAIWRLYGYEPSRPGHAFLVQYFEVGGGDADASPRKGIATPKLIARSAGEVKLVDAAVGPDIGTILYPDCLVGDDRCHILSEPKRDGGGPLRRRRHVRTLPVEHHLPKELSSMDVLIFDTGWEDLAAATSDTFVHRQSVNLLLIRVRLHDLVDVPQTLGAVRTLGKYGYLCFAPVKRVFAIGHTNHTQLTMRRLSNGCLKKDAELAERLPPKPSNPHDRQPSFMMVCGLATDADLIASIIREGSQVENAAEYSCHDTTVAASERAFYDRVMSKDKVLAFDDFSQCRESIKRDTPL